MSSKLYFNFYKPTNNKICLTYTDGIPDSNGENTNYPTISNIDKYLTDIIGHDKLNNDKYHYLDGSHWSIDEINIDKIQKSIENDGGTVLFDDFF